MLISVGLFVFAQLGLNQLVSSSDVSQASKVNCSADDIEKLMRDHRIIPDVLKAPAKQCLEIFYDDVKVQMGQNIDYVEMITQPTDIKWKHEENTFYTLIITGLDIPTKDEPVESEFQHWVVGNIPGLNVTGGQAVFPYEPPGMCYGSGPHRVAFILFKQKDGKPVHFEEMDLGLRRTSVSRAYFSTPKFAKKYKFEEPAEAINFFEFDI